ncbi:MAG: hypothetical protein LBJ32_03585 [Oscillospiraceae bacterium]|nr:hypothetical protein [Oscillospiraceae bacterium]
MIKATDKNNTNKKTSTDKNNTNKKTSSVVKFVGIGGTALLATYYIIKRCKHIKGILPKNFVESESNFPEESQKFKYNFLDIFPKQKEIHEGFQKRLLERFRRWFENYGYEKQYEIIRRIEQNIATDEELKEFVNYNLEIIELARRYLEVFSNGLNLENYKKDKEITIINTGAIICLFKEDLFKKCDDNHKTLEEVLGDLNELVSVLFIIFGLLSETFSSYYFCNVVNVSDINFHYVSYLKQFLVRGCKIIVNDKFARYENKALKEEIGICNSEVELILINAYEKNEALIFLNNLSENLKNPFNVQSNSNISKLFIPHRKEKNRCTADRIKTVLLASIGCVLKLLI